MIVADIWFENQEKSILMKLFGIIHTLWESNKIYQQEQFWLCFREFSRSPQNDNSKKHGKEQENVYYGSLFEKDSNIFWPFWIIKQNAENVE